MYHPHFRHTAISVHVCEYVTKSFRQNISVFF